MGREPTLKRILDGGIVAVVRFETSEPLVKVVEALALGGVTAAEITFTVPDAVEVIRQVRREVGDSVVLGAGTVLDPETARAAILAGAEYIVAPIVNLEVIRLCRRYDKVVMPGAFTPTEVVGAWEAGADVVKVFPADVGGPPYLKALRGPLPQIRLMPTGGVDLSTAESFIKAGACCLGIGSSLVDPKAIARGDFTRIRELAAQFVAIVRQARAASCSGYAPIATVKLRPKYCRRYPRHPNHVRSPRVSEEPSTIGSISATPSIRTSGGFISS
jgi:2-dehydro-3-deoxyphosphogluconate aldolase / (4S)-4-hydroxy-2-oxoglutarate aldolase